MNLRAGNPDVTVEVSLENYVGNQSFTDSFISIKESQIGSGDRDTSEKDQAQAQPQQPQQDLLRQEPTPFQEERAQISSQSVKANSPNANQQLPDTHAAQEELLHRGDDEVSAVKWPDGTVPTPARKTSVKLAPARQNWGSELWQPTAPPDASFSPLCTGPVTPEQVQAIPHIAQTPLPQIQQPHHPPRAPPAPPHLQP